MNSTSLQAAGQAALDAVFSVESLLDPAELEWQQRGRRVARDLIAPVIEEDFENRYFRDELIPAIAAEGLLGMHISGYGCAGASATSYGAVCLELESADSGWRTFVSVQGSLAMSAIAKFGSEDQKNEWLPRMASGEVIGCFALTEPDGGSDPASMQTRAVRDGDDWLISGSKRWIGLASIAGVAVVWAQTEDGVRGFLVPRGTPGFTAQDIHHKLSLRASATSELALQDVRLPASAMLPEARGLAGPLGCLDEARFGIVWGALGAARDCIEATLDYASTRVQFDKPIAAFQLTQAKLADSAVELYKGLLLALHLGRLKDDGRLRPEQVSVGKLNNVREAIEIARTCRTILGGSGITLEYPVLRHANNLESVLTYEGTSEVHQLVIGQALTGESAFQ